MIDKKEFLRRKLEIPKKATIVLFRNPKEFTHFMIEKINPAHKMLIWGKLKKKYRKGSYYIRAGKIIIPTLMLLTLNPSVLISLLPSILYSFILIDVYFTMSNMEGLIKCLLELKAVLDREKPLWA